MQCIPIGRRIVHVNKTHENDDFRSKCRYIYRSRCQIKGQLEYRFQRRYKAELGVI